MEIVNKLSYEKISKPDIESVEKEKQEFKLIDTITRTKGLRLFSFNSMTRKLTEVDIKYAETAVLKFEENKLKATDYSKAKVVIDPRNIFFEALNYKTASKRVDKYLTGKIKELSNLKRCNGTIKFF